MSKVICPECNSEVSQYAEACPICGFPIKQFMNDNNLFDTNKTWICPKCANMHWGEYSPFPPRLKCEYCNSIFIETKEDSLELFKLSILKSNENEYKEKSINIANDYGKNQFSKQLFEQRYEKINQRDIERNKNREQQKQLNQSPQVHCKYCNSTNVTKITVAKRSISTYLFGLGSSKIAKQWHCNDCGSDF